MGVVSVFRYVAFEFVPEAVGPFEGRSWTGDPERAPQPGIAILRNPALTTEHAGTGADHQPRPEWSLRRSDGCREWSSRAYSRGSPRAARWRASIISRCRTRLRPSTRTRRNMSTASESEWTDSPTEQGRSRNYLKAIAFGQLAVNDVPSVSREGVAAHGGDHVW